MIADRLPYVYDIRKDAEHVLIRVGDWSLTDIVYKDEDLHGTIKWLDGKVGCAGRCCGFHLVPKTTEITSFMLRYLLWAVHRTDMPLVIKLTEETMSNFFDPGLNEC